MRQNLIIYISKATKELSAQDVEQLASAAAVKNHDFDITGLLLHIGNYFVQVLEGQPLTLSALLKKIEQDKRHTEMQVIYQAPTSSKMFAQWNMGYFNIEAYYQANRLDVFQLQRYAKETFIEQGTSKEAIVQIIRSMPDLMQSWQIEKPETAAA